MAEAQDEADIDPFVQAPTDEALTKLNKLISRSNTQTRDLKRLKNMSKYIVVMCEDNEPAFFQILAHKIDQGEILEEE